MHILFIGLHGITAIHITLYQMKDDNLDSDTESGGRAGYHDHIQGATMNCSLENDTNVALTKLIVFNSSNIINVTSTAILNLKTKHVPFQ
jgi:hypothetical protein